MSKSQAFLLLKEANIQVKVLLRLLLQCQRLMPNDYLTQNDLSKSKHFTKNCNKISTKIYSNVHLGSLRIQFQAS